MADKKRISVSTPKGIAKYPWLNNPCKTFDPNGIYKTGLLLQANSPEAIGLMKQIDEWIEESYQEAVNKANEASQKALADGKGADAAKKKAEAVAIQKADPPYASDLDKDSGEETGYIEFKFKLDAQVVSKKTGKTIQLFPKLFDSIGNPLSTNVSIFGGSVIKVNFTPRNYYVSATKKAGVSLQLNAVQVIELVSGGSGSTANDFGFGKEAGYIYEQPIEEGGSVTSDSIPEGADNF
jgi:hypothetical protein